MFIRRSRLLAITRRSFSSSTSNEAVLLNFENNNHVARIVLNNPKVHNSMSEEVINSLHEKLDKVRESTARCLILSSSGKNFSAGANLNYMKRQGSFTREENISDALHLSNLFNKIFEMPIPTIAVAKGASFGGALGLISACDIGICLQRSSFCFSEAKLGLIPATIGPFVINRIGASNARKLFLTAELFNSDTAKEIGLIHDIGTDEEELQQKESDIVKYILSNSPNALSMVKQLFKTLDKAHLTDIESRAATAELLADVRSSDEAKEGLASFFEKRKPWYNIS